MKLKPIRSPESPGQKTALMQLIVLALSSVAFTGYLLSGQTQWQTPAWLLVLALATFISAMIWCWRQNLTVALVMLLLGQLILFTVIYLQQTSTFNLAKMSPRPKSIDIAQVMTNTQTDIAVRVKTAVVFAAGDHTPDVHAIKDDDKIGKWGLNDNQLFFLTDYLNIAVAAANAHAQQLNIADVKGADTFQDLIDLYNKAVKP